MLASMVQLTRLANPTPAFLQRRSVRRPPAGQSSSYSSAIWGAKVRRGKPGVVADPLPNAVGAPGTTLANSRHPHGPKPKLTRHQRQEALARRDAGENVTNVAGSYAVVHSTISRLRRALNA
jgi:hypothetical protein